MNLNIDTSIVDIGAFSAEILMLKAQISLSPPNQSFGFYGLSKFLKHSNQQYLSTIALIEFGNVVAIFSFFINLSIKFRCVALQVPISTLSSSQLLRNSLKLINH